MARGKKFYALIDSAIDAADRGQCEESDSILESAFTLFERRLRGRISRDAVGDAMTKGVDAVRLCLHKQGNRKLR